MIIVPNIDKKRLRYPKQLLEITKKSKIKMSKEKSAEDIIKDFFRERLIDTIYKCYGTENKNYQDQTIDQTYDKCREAIWDSNNSFIERKIRMLERLGYTLNDIFPIKVVPPSHKLIKQPIEILSLEDLKYKIENFEDITDVDKKQDVIKKLINKFNRTAEQYKLWKTGEVFEGTHDGFTLDEELEFYKNKLNKLISL